ncbi:glutamate-1-semialdehyde 2,1-aminomutase [Nanchangia anserum]|uniref:Glutamate-1-semialdehyde 2,1-aminomutase n=1 Tax=Nanchangia anserum TaxID=2692125 RepID=A0A8I0GB91_9ACTO|nr:glutamate-1-semialdehyde 2,1-aminomutase [Nanchangia anserum]MBD3689608.1 glutamate-1-semialdehyde 2,1-aminomutase [Nanchangia anserum]QOX81791.1 glutamate-1-semialdehyde 2,1-aminomutase [Nanchangia anserum]
MSLTASQSLFARSQLATPGGVNSPVRAFGSVGGTPSFIADAKGPYVRDVDGRIYVDLVGTWGPALLGHAHPEVVATVTEAAARGLSFGAPTAAEAELAEAVTARVPAAEQVRLVSTGTEATMTAIRLARGVTGRDLLVKFAGCYHGHSDSLLAQAGSGVATQGLPGSAGVPADIAALTIVLPYNDEDALRECFAEHGRDIAAVITEACPANMGIVPPAPGFNRAIREVTRDHGALMITDEVLTGFRVSPAGFWGLETGWRPARLPAVLPSDLVGAEAMLEARQEWCRGQVGDLDYVPDLFTFGKVIGGGMPLAALGGSAEIMGHLAPLGPVYQAGTLSGNPLATAAGLATLKLADDACYARVDAVAQSIRTYLSATLSAHDIPHVINSAGSLFSVFFGEEVAESGVSSYADAQRQDEDLYRAFFHAMRDAGVALPPSCYEAWFVSRAHDDDAVAAIFTAIDTAVAEVAQTR